MNDHAGSRRTDLGIAEAVTQSTFSKSGGVAQNKRGSIAARRNGIEQKRIAVRIGTRRITDMAFAAAEAVERGARSRLAGDIAIDTLPEAKAARFTGRDRIEAVGRVTRPCRNRGRFRPGCCRKIGFCRMDDDELDAAAAAARDQDQHAQVFAWCGRPDPDQSRLRHTR